MLTEREDSTRSSLTPRITFIRSSNAQDRDMYSHVCRMPFPTSVALRFRSFFVDITTFGRVFLSFYDGIVLWRSLLEVASSASVVPNFLFLFFKCQITTLQFSCHPSLISFSLLFWFTNILMYALMDLLTNRRGTEWIMLWCKTKDDKRCMSELNPTET